MIGLHLFLMCCFFLQGKTAGSYCACIKVRRKKYMVAHICRKQNKETELENLSHFDVSFVSSLCMCTYILLNTALVDPTKVVNNSFIFTWSRGKYFFLEKRLFQPGFIRKPGDSAGLPAIQANNTPNNHHPTNKYMKNRQHNKTIQVFTFTTASATYPYMSATSSIAVVSTCARSWKFS